MWVGISGEMVCLREDQTVLEKREASDIPEFLVDLRLVKGIYVLYLVDNIFMRISC